MRKHRSIPSPFRAEIHAFHDAPSLAVVRAAIDLRDRVQLSRSKTVVPIRAGWTLSVGEIDLRLERAARRIVDDAIADAVGGIAFRQDGVAQNFPLGEAL